MMQSLLTATRMAIMTEKKWKQQVSLTIRRLEPLYIAVDTGKWKNSRFVKIVR